MLTLSGGITPWFYLCVCVWESMQAVNLFSPSIVIPCFLPAWSVSLNIMHRESVLHMHTNPLLSSIINSLICRRSAPAPGLIPWIFLRLAERGAKTKWTEITVRTERDVFVWSSLNVLTRALTWKVLIVCSFRRVTSWRMCDFYQNLVLIFFFFKLFHHFYQF